MLIGDRIPLERIVLDLHVEVESSTLTEQDHQAHFNAGEARIRGMRHTDGYVGRFFREAGHLDVADDGVVRIQEDDQVLVSREGDVFLRRGDEPQPLLCYSRRFVRLSFLF